MSIHESFPESRSRLKSAIVAALGRVPLPVASGLAAIIRTVWPGFRRG